MLRGQRYKKTKRKIQVGTTQVLTRSQGLRLKYNVTNFLMFRNTSSPYSY